MPEIFSYEWDTDVYKGKTSFNTGLFINGQYVDGCKGTTIEWVLHRVLSQDTDLPLFSVINPSSWIFSVWPLHHTDSLSFQRTDSWSQKSLRRQRRMWILLSRLPRRHLRLHGAWTLQEALGQICYGNLLSSSSATTMSWLLSRPWIMVFLPLSPTVIENVIDEIYL